MANEQIKEKIESIWLWLRSLSAADIMHQISLSQAEAETIIGKNDIEKVKTLPLLKLIVYELIIFANHKCTQPSPNRHNHKIPELSLSGQKPVRPVARILEIKQLLGSISDRRKQTSNEIVMDRYEYKSLTRKLIGLEEELCNDERRSNEVETVEMDPEGSELMINQLEELLKKKENRIRELNAELQENFNDKQQLEDEIQQLQNHNTELEERTRELEQQCNVFYDQGETLRQQLRGQLGKLPFLNNRPLPSKTLVHCSSNTESIPTECDFPVISKQESIHDSNLFLAMYTPAKGQNQKRTAKKLPSTILSPELSEQNLLQSLRCYQQSKQLENQDHSFEHLLLLQAGVIEHLLLNTSD